MATTKIPTNFIYPTLTPKTYFFGDSKFTSVPLKVDGDWREYLPTGELQKKGGLESEACYVYAQLHTISTLQSEQFDLSKPNFSERFNAISCNRSKENGDPVAAAESMRKKDGIIPEILLPFSDDIKTWDDYYSFKDSHEALCRQTGKEFLNRWELNYDIVYEIKDQIEDKYSKLKEALEYSPCPISVYGVIDETGNYVPKPIGEKDTHLVEAVYVDQDNSIWVFDTYQPFLKKLPPMYNSDFGMRWSVTQLKEGEVKKNLLDLILDFFSQIINKLIHKNA